MRQIFSEAEISHSLANQPRKKGLTVYFFLLSLQCLSLKKGVLCPSSYERKNYGTFVLQLKTGKTSGATNVSFFGSQVCKFIWNAPIV